VQEVSEIYIVGDYFILLLYIVVDALFGGIIGELGTSNDYLAFERVQVLVRLFESYFDLGLVADELVEVLVDVVHAHL
jgi:hypothetical protein